MKAINTYINNVDICKCGCGILYKIAFNNGKLLVCISKLTNTIDENNVKVVSSGGIETAVRIINIYLDDRDICEDALKLFLVITPSYTKNDGANKIIVEHQVKAGKEGGIETIVKVMNVHVDCPLICEWGCRTLLNMITNNGKNTEKK